MREGSPPSAAPARRGPPPIPRGEATPARLSTVGRRLDELLALFAAEAEWQQEPEREKGQPLTAEADDNRKRAHRSKLRVALLVWDGRGDDRARASAGGEARSSAGAGGAAGGGDGEPRRRAAGWCVHRRRRPKRVDKAGWRSWARCSSGAARTRKRSSCSSRPARRALRRGGWGWRSPAAGPSCATRWREPKADRDALIEAAAWPAIG